MVGRSGRSKGCITCRRRKVGCDQTRPDCIRCFRAGHKCEGYANTEFIDVGDEFKRLNKPKLHGKTIKSSTTAITSSSSSSSSSASVSTIPSVSSSSTSISSTSAQNLAIVPVNSNALQLYTPTVDTQETYICYTLRNLGRDRLAKVEYPQSYAHKWPPFEFCNLEGDKPLSRASLKSLAEAYFGAQHGRKDIVQKGLKDYGAALVKLNKTLSDPKGCQAEDTLVAVIIMGIFEFLTSTTQTGWINHGLGLGKILEVRGPIAHTNGHELALFEHVRFSVILASISARKRTFLERPEWKTTPWSLNVYPKSSFHYLQDFMADLPGLMQDTDILKIKPDMVHNKMHLRSVLCKLLRDLQEWRQGWERDHANAAFEVSAFIADKVTGTGSSELFPTVVYMQTLRLANELTVYNSILVLALRICMLLEILPQEVDLNGLDMSGYIQSNPMYSIFLPFDSFSPIIIRSCYEICRLVDFHLLHGEIATATLFLLFPLRVAQIPLVGTREGEWIEKVMKQIGERSQDKWEFARVFFQIPTHVPIHGIPVAARIKSLS